MLGSDAPFVCTHSGRMISLLEPDPDAILLDDIAHGLSLQCRFNGQTHVFYSVAQHSLLVASLVPSGQRLEALLHDAAEAYLGDLITPVKVLLPGFAEIEARFMRTIHRALGLGDTSTPEIRRADLIALATEKRDLLPEATSPWQSLQGIEPLTGRVRPWTADRARQAFLEAYHAYGGHHRTACLPLAA